MNEVVVMREFLSAHWATVVIAAAIVIIFAMLLYKFRFKLCGCLKWLNQNIACILALIVLIVSWVIVPFAFRKYCPREVLNLMHESVDTIVTEKRQLPIQNGKTGECIVEEYVTTKNERSRAPAVFILVLACGLYISILWMLIGALTRLLKAYKRNKLLQESLENIMSIIDKLDDEDAVKAYQKKILVKLIEIPNFADLSMKSNDPYGRDLDQWPLWRLEGAEALMKHVHGYMEFCRGAKTDPFICTYMHPWEFHEMPKGILHYGEGAVLPDEFIVRNCGAYAEEQLDLWIGMLKKEGAEFRQARSVDID